MIRSRTDGSVELSIMESMALRVPDHVSMALEYPAMCRRLSDNEEPHCCLPDSESKLSFACRLLSLCGSTRTITSTTLVGTTTSTTQVAGP
uniref:Uncharacterized protein n=1 Tax=Arundo donax TaxID=35708 RepID=A0A0A9AYA5_ARUDO